MLSETIQTELKQLLTDKVREYRSGQLFFSTNVIKKAASLIGINYTVMGAEKRKLFRIDLVLAYQNGFYKNNFNY